MIIWWESWVLGVEGRLEGIKNVLKYFFVLEEDMDIVKLKKFIGKSIYISLSSSRKLRVNIR